LVLLIAASWVARIIGVSHWHWLLRIFNVSLLENLL
jgi:hypothetical protein